MILAISDTTFNYWMIPSYELPAAHIITSTPTAASVVVATVNLKWYYSALVHSRGL